MVNLLQITFSIYLFSALVFLAQSVAKKRNLLRTADKILRVGFLMHTLMIFLRWYEARRPPFANMFEALVLFAWSIILVYIIFDFLYKAKFLAIAVNILVLVIMFFVLPLESTIKPLMPALQSRWISIHVVTYFIGYGALSIAFFTSLIYLVFSKKNPADSSILLYLDRLSYQLIIFGFPFLTIGITTGSTWANVAWGNYWSWDPKETCSLIAWLVYVVYLHLRLLRKWKDKKAAYLSIIGFLVTLFTFVGVNFILPGLHSYF
jgi:cytochrome c-type biogenesis protein CcsB